MIPLSKPVVQTALIYGFLLAVSAFLLEWLQLQYFLKIYPMEVYIAMIAVGFAALGIWIGTRLTSRDRSNTFQQNHAAIKSLAISKREMEVLEALADAQSNKEIARSLNISPNTVKTHVAHIFEKLQVTGRVKAIEEARTLHLIP